MVSWMGICIKKRGNGGKRFLNNRNVANDMVIEDTAEKDAKRGATEDAEDSLDPKEVSDLEDKAAIQDTTHSESGAGEFKEHRDEEQRAPRRNPIRPHYAFVQFQQIEDSKRGNGIAITTRILERQPSL